MRIGLLHPALAPLGGAERALLALAQALAERGHEVSCFTTRLPDAAPAGVRWIELPQRPDWLGERAHSRWLGARIAARLPELDLLLPHNPPAAWWAVDAQRCARRRVPVLWYCEEPDRLAWFSITDAWLVARSASLPEALPRRDLLRQRVADGAAAERSRRRRRRRQLDRSLVPRIDAIAANSRHTAGLVARIYAREAAVIPPGLAGPLAPPAPIPARGGLVCVAQRHAWKNPFAYLGVVAALARGGRRDLRLDLVGDVDAEALRAEAARLGIAQQIALLGPLSEPDKLARLGAARLCLSLPLCEPFGLVPVEAMAQGTPVVASQHGGPAEVVAPGETGLLVDPLDPAAAARAVLELYGDLPRLQRMSASAQERVRRLYRLELFAERIEGLALALLREARDRA